jgi:hypothetical protein
MVAVCVKVADVAVMVTVAGPVVAVLLAVKVSVLVVVAGLVLKEAVTPLGRPEADKLTLLLKPFCGVMVIVLVPVAPCITLRVLGAAERVKFGNATAVTVRLMVVVFVKLPEVPVMVIEAVPVVAVLLAVNVSALADVAGLVLKEAVTLLGSPEAERVTPLLKPFCGVIVMVLVPLAPCVILRLLGDADREKFGVGAGFVLIATLSKVAMARLAVFPLLTASPTYTFCPMLMVWLVPTCTQLTPSNDEKLLSVLPLRTVFTQ